MPGLIPLIANLSLDVTRGLVLAGLGLGFDGLRFTNTSAPAALAITDATNGTPIVITTAQPHTIPFAANNAMERQLHAVISGVLGNDGANNIDTTPTTGNGPRSTTSGQSLGTLCIATGPSTLALYAGYDGTGALVPLAGSGTYTSGGTVVPAFTRGRILIGREFVKEATASNAPPACIFVPVGSRWGGKSASIPSASAPDRAAQKAQRSLATERTVIEVHTWGQSLPPDPALDFDRTQAIYQQVVATSHLIAGGRYELIDGTWDDQREKATALIKAGHWDVMRIAYQTPVVDAALPFLPGGIALDPTTYIQLPDGSPAEVGCNG